MFSRSIEDLSPACLHKYVKFAVAMKSAGIPFMLTCTLRQEREQFVLYAQGRMSVQEVNRLRKWVGWAYITKAQNNIVTWTLNSAHLPNKDGKSDAFDIVILKNGNAPTWEPKADINDNDKPDYLEAAEIGRSVGLTAGAFWKTPDLCHFQV